MTNIILFAIEIVVCFSAVLLFDKLFGKYGLIAWVCFAVVCANIQTSKQINLLGLSSVLGTVLFASIFLSTDILTEKYGVKTAKTAVYLSLATLIAYLGFSQLSLLYVPNEYDMVSGAMETLFALSPRICISSMIMFFLSNLADVFLFNKLKSVCNGKQMWLRNNVSTIACNCLENFLFVFGAFIGVYHIAQCLEIAFTTCIVEIVVALCDTPFLYLACKSGVKKFD